MFLDNVDIFNFYILSWTVSIKTCNEYKNEYMNTIMIITRFIYKYIHIQLLKENLQKMLEKMYKIIYFNFSWSNIFCKYSLLVYNNTKYMNK